MEAVEATFEGEASERYLINQGGALHQCPDEVISHQVHEQFLTHHGWRQTAQDVHAEQNLDLAEMQIHVDKAYLQQVKRQHSELLILQVVGSDLTAFAVEDEGVGPVPS